jgi:peroxiredoxin
LRRWEELRPELSARGVEIVAICADTPRQVKAGRRKHGAKGVMLSDPDLVVTDLYNLRHDRTIAPRQPMITGLPIPTTILTDADGIVRWIDRSGDYQIRSNPDRVLAAIDRNIPRRDA